ncbi:MAG: inner membrane-spanning protein YciB [Caulobacteraceae bacterium]
MILESEQDRKRHPMVGAIADFGGLALFLVAFLITHDLIKSTWALVAGSAIGLAVAYAFERRIAPMPLIAGGAALVFGGLTLVFHDPIFLKMKPTFMNTAFSLALFIGLAIKRSPIKLLMGEAMQLPDDVWRTLTWRYAFFFLFVAVLNEIIWRTQPDSTWVVFRFPGLLILTFVFSALQAPLMMKHMPKGGENGAEPPSE